MFDFLTDFSEVVKIALKSKNGPTGRFTFLNTWILRLNNIVNDTIKFDRHFLATKAQHSRRICLELKIWSPISFPHLFLLKQLCWMIQQLLTSIFQQKKIPQYPLDFQKR